MAKNSKNWQNNLPIEQPDIILSLNNQKGKGRGKWWWPKGPWKRTVEKIQEELEFMTEFCFLWVEVEVDVINSLTGRKNKGKKRIYPIFLYELSASRWYTRKSFTQAIKDLDEKTYWELKWSFSATLESFEEVIQSRLFRKGLEWAYNPTITKMWLAANHGRVTERTENKNDNTIQLTPEEESDVNDILKQN